MPEESPPNIEELLTAILETLTCIDEAMHDISDHLIPEEIALDEAG